MSTSKTAISWTDRTWSPLRGCSMVSTGCEHCYALRIAARFERPGGPWDGLVRRTAAGPKWSGVVKLLPEVLEAPLRWRRPSRVFVNPVSDLFHEAVPDEYIERVFGVMAVASWHVFQVLTKRPERMLAWFKEQYQVPLTDGRIGWEGHSDRIWGRDAFEFANPHDNRFWTEDGALKGAWTWPLPNVHLGVSAEDQATFDTRAEILTHIPAAVRFISFEPLLGNVDASNYLWRIHWCIVGGESGGPSERRLVERCWHSYPGWDGPNPGAIVSVCRYCSDTGWRPKPEALQWVRSIRDQCVAAGTRFHFKGWGGPRFNSAGRLLDGRTWDEFPEEARQPAAVS